MGQMRKLFLILWILLSVPKMFAVDFDKEILLQTDSFIKSMPEVFQNAAGLKDMTPEQKVAFVLNKTESLSKKYVADKMKDKFKSATLKFMQKSFRAYEFKKLAVPVITNSAVLKKGYSWSQIDSKIASNVGRKMHLLSGAISTASIAWDAYDAYKKGQVGAALKSISGSVSEMLAGAYIPGWSFISLGASTVKFTGNYIISYATDTKIEAVLNNIYDVKSNPSAFANKIYKMTPSEIKKSVDDNMEMILYSGVYEGKGTQKGEDALKEKIVAALMGYRSQIVLSMKKAQQAEKQKQKLMQKYIDETKQAQSSLKLVGEEANNRLAVYLKKLAKYKTEVLKIKGNEDAKKTEEEKKYFESIGASLPFVKINVDGELEAYRNAIKICYSTSLPPSGYTKAACEDVDRIYSKINEKEFTAYKENLKTYNKGMALYHSPGSNLPLGYDTRLSNLMVKSHVDEDTVDRKIGTIADAINERVSQLTKLMQDTIHNIQQDIKAEKEKLAYKRQAIFEKIGELRIAMTGAVYDSDLGSLMAQRVKERLEISPGDVAAAAKKLREEIRIMKEEKPLLESYKKALLSVNNDYLQEMNKIRDTLKKKFGHFAHSYSHTNEDGHVIEDQGVWIVDEPHIVDDSHSGSYPSMFEFTFPLDNHSVVEKIKALSGNPKSKPLTIAQENLQILEDYEVQDSVAKIANYLYKKYFIGIRNVSHLLGHKNDTRTDWEEGQYKSNVLKWKTESVDKSNGEKYLKQLEDYWKANQRGLEAMQRQVKILKHNKIKYSHFSVANYLQVAALVDAFPIIIKRLKNAKTKVAAKRQKILDEGVDALLKEDKASLKQYFKNPNNINILYQISKNTKRYKEYALQGSRYYKYAIFQEEINIFDKQVNDLLTKAKLRAKEQKDKALQAQMKLDQENARKSFLEIESAATDMIEFLKTNNVCSQIESYKQMFEMQIVKKYNYGATKIEPSPSIQSKIDTIQRLLNRPCVDEEENIALVKHMYAQFKEMYEAEDVAGLMSQLSDDWSAASDGTTMNDLEEYLGRSFRIFDEIQYNMSNLSVQPLGLNHYRISYDVTIIGEIYDEDITHEEKSSVQETVIIKNGKPLILKTIGGQYWSIK